jgi:hypothetical protein
MVSGVDVVVSRAVEARERLEKTEIAVARLHQECEDHRNFLRRLGWHLMTRRARRLGRASDAHSLFEQGGPVLQRGPG